MIAPPGSSVLPHLFPSPVNPHSLERADKSLDVVGAREVVFILNHKVWHARHALLGGLAHILIHLCTTSVAVNDGLLEVSFRNARLDRHLLQHGVIRNIALLLEKRRKQPVNGAVLHILAVPARQAHQAMRVPRVARAAAEAEGDADGGAGLGDAGLHGVEAVGAELLDVVVALGGAGGGTLGPLRVELVGEVGDGEGVGGVLGVPELFGEDELFAADVAPWTDGVGRHVDLDPGHDVCWVGQCINM